MIEREETRDEYLDREEQHEHDSLRARIAELEGSIVALEEEHSDLIGKHNETIAERDLLAALVALVKVIDRADDRECPAAALEMARAAIQKAEGK